MKKTKPMPKGIVFDETEEARKLASVYMEIADEQGEYKPLATLGTGRSKKFYETKFYVYW